MGKIILLFCSAKKNAMFCLWDLFGKLHFKSAFARQMKMNSMYFLFSESSSD